MSDVDGKIRTMLGAAPPDPAAPHPMALCESPMERLFLAGLLCDGWVPMPTWVSATLGGQMGAGFAKWSAYEPVKCALADVVTLSIVCLQYGVAARGSNYRIDFAVLRGDRAPVAVEIDGHAYHSTQDRLTADKTRDRKLTAAGWLVNRFSGSDVYADPVGRAQELRMLVGGTTAAHRVRKARLEPPPLGDAADVLTTLSAAESCGDWQSQVQVLDQMQDRARRRRNAG